MPSVPNTSMERNGANIRPMRPAKPRVDADAIPGFEMGDVMIQCGN